LYGIDEAGQAAFSELLQDVERDTLRSLAHERLSQWHAVEIWEGPVCLVRVRRPPLAAGGA
jgi:hypothetical protein